MSLTFAHGNVHGSFSGVRTLMRDSPDTISVNEATRVIATFAKLRRYLSVHGVNAADARRGPKDVVAMQLRKYDSFGQFAFLGSPASRPTRIAPERWFSVVAFKHPMFGPVCMTSWHPHAAVANKPGDLDRVEKYAEQVRRLDAWLTFCKALDFYNIVMGDIQLTPNSKFDGLSPFEVFDKHGMHHRSVGIDAVAYQARKNRKPVKLARFEEISKAELNSDHPGFRGALVF